MPLTGFNLPLFLKILSFLLVFLLVLLDTLPSTPTSSPLYLKYPSQGLESGSLFLYYSGSYVRTPMLNLSCGEATCEKQLEIPTDIAKIRVFWLFSLEKTAEIPIEVGLWSRKAVFSMEYSQKIRFSASGDCQTEDLWLLEEVLQRRVLEIELNLGSGSAKMDILGAFAAFGGLFWLVLAFLGGVLAPICEVSRLQTAMNELFCLEFGDKRRKKELSGFGRSFFDPPKRAGEVILSVCREKKEEVKLVECTPRPNFNQIIPKIPPQNPDLDLQSEFNEFPQAKKQPGIAFAESQKVSVRDLRPDVILSHRLGKPKAPFLTQLTKEKNPLSVNLSLKMKFSDYFLLFLRNFGLKVSNKRVELYLEARKKLLKGLDPLFCYRKLEELEKLKGLLLDKSQLRIFNEYLRTFRVVLRELEENKKADYKDFYEIEDFSNCSFNLELIRSFRVIRERLENHNTVDKRLIGLLEGDFLTMIEKMNLENS